MGQYSEEKGAPLTLELLTLTFPDDYCDNFFMHQSLSPTKPTVTAITQIERPSDLLKTIEVQRAAWGLDDLTVVPPHILTAICKTGGSIFGAFADSELVAFIVGMISRDATTGETYLTSHMMGVLPNLQSQNIGCTLKLEQRRWAHESGIRLIRWTYDPMETRNANLNIRKLGGRVVKFLPNYYGDEGGSQLHLGLPTDRFLLEWNVSEPVPQNRSLGGPMLLQLSDSEICPRVDLLKDLRLDIAQIPVPLDFQLLKQRDFIRAWDWQSGVREVCQRIFEQGDMWISGFHVNPSEGLGYYVVERRRNSNTVR